MTEIKVPFCPKCHTKRDGKFCYKCGSELIEVVRACECGNNDIWPHEDFCSECGKPSPLSQLV